MVYLKNSDAVKMAELLRAAISAGSTGNGGGGPAGGTGGSPTAEGRTTVTQNPNAPSGTSGTAGGASAQSTTPVAASARPSTGGQVQADPATNSLIITASEPVYRQMRQVIDQLDVRRAQVYVEALMIQVDAQKAADIGFQWQGLLGAGGNSYVGGGTNFAQTPNGGGNIIDLAVAAGTASKGSTTTTTTTSSGTTISGQVGNGLNIGWVPKINGIYTLAALAHFLETNAGGNVLSTPNLIAMDNEEAKIVVGQNIPLITGSFTNTGGASSSVNPFQTVERQDVGITLRIKSQVGENGTVRMTIYEENSSVSGTSSQVTNKTSVETYVTVDDGSMIALGGLIKDEYNDSTTGVPLLQSIPMLGNLFKSSDRTRHKSNLMLFLRPDRDPQPGRRGQAHDEPLRLDPRAAAEPAARPQPADARQRRPGRAGGPARHAHRSGRAGRSADAVDPDAQRLADPRPAQSAAAGADEVRRARPSWAHAIPCPTPGPRRIRC